MSKIAILVGPSGSGKTTIAEAIISKTNFVKITTCTTRAPRPGEINGVHYNYFSDEEFKKMIAENKFVEYCMYANKYYGTRFQELDDAVNENKNIIIVMDINGARAIRERYPENSISIFLDREKYDLIMAILERDIPDEDKAHRIIQLDEDAKAKDLCDYIVFNDDLKQAINEVKNLIA